MWDYDNVRDRRPLQNKENNRRVRLQLHRHRCFDLRIRFLEWVNYRRCRDSVAPESMCNHYILKWGTFIANKVVILFSRVELWNICMGKHVELTQRRSLNIPGCTKLLHTMSWRQRGRRRKKKIYPSLQETMQRMKLCSKIFAKIYGHYTYSHRPSVKIHFGPPELSANDYLFTLWTEKSGGCIDNSHATRKKKKGITLQSLTARSWCSLQTKEDKSEEKKSER